MIIVVNVLIYDDTNEYRVYLGSGGVELRSRAPGVLATYFRGKNISSAESWQGINCFNISKAEEC